MTQFISLPLGCKIRPARLTDYLAIVQLKTEFGRLSEEVESDQWLQLLNAYLPIIVMGCMFLSLAISILFAALTLAILLVGAIIVVAWLEVSASWVIECQGEVVAQATLYLYERHSELYSLCVLPSWRHRGLGSSLVQYLTLKATLPLYLAARPKLVQFYTRLGFVCIPPSELPNEVRKSLGVDRDRPHEIVTLVVSSPQKTSG